MIARGAGTPRRVATFTRVLLGVVIVLVFLAGIQLYVLSEHTDRFFAWTIALPLTAAFLGAGYWSALVSALIAIREDSWVRVRSTVPAAFTSTTLLLIATLIHLDKFHLNSPEFITRLAAWVWVAVYVVVPPALILGFVIQRRLPGSDLASRRDLPAGVRILLVLQAVYGIVIGAGLFLVPQTMAQAWAWVLTPLTARAVGAWFCAYGVAAIVMLWENDLFRVRAAMFALLAFGLLQGLALLRYASSVDWGRLSTWSYVIFLLATLLASGASLLAVRSPLEKRTRPPEVPPVERVGG